MNRNIISGGATAKNNFKSPASRQFKSPVSTQFKSPLTRSNTESPKASYTDLKVQVADLQKKLQDTTSEVEKLEAEGYKEAELQAHIEKLHEYNEIKDVGQMVLGRIAVVQGVQSRDLYKKYDLNLTD